MRVCYLGSGETMPGSPNRRGDAFEHDQMMDALGAAFRSKDAILEDKSWDEDGVDWSSFDAVIIGTTWDYPERLDEFLAVLEKIATQTKLFNSPDLVVWNSHKTYLRDLEYKGVSTVPTLWLDKVTCENAAHAFDRLSSEILVFKQQVGANAGGQYKLKADDMIPDMPEPMMVQPFLKSIQDEGEISFIFIDGNFCHAVQKKPVKGEYRIQSSYGGIETEYVPLGHDIACAQSVLEMIDFDMPLYARVDMVRGSDGGLCVMELEMVEPFLYPVQGPELGTKIYQAIEKRLLT
ncbi:MAG: RimK family alpha-L-glutamate ligase [Kordiimonas sp.]